MAKISPARASFTHAGTCNTTRTEHLRLRSGDIQPSRNICRALFGPIDHDKLRRDIEKDRRGVLEDQKRKYNFDFEKDEPLVGRYLWEPIIAKRDRTSTDQKPLKSNEKSCAADETRTSGNLCKSEHCKKVLKNDTKTPKISDFFRLKKRKLDEPSQHGNTDPTKTTADRSGRSEERSAIKKKYIPEDDHKRIMIEQTGTKQDSTKNISRRISTQET